MVGSRGTKQIRAGRIARFVSDVLGSRLETYRGLMDAMKMDEANWTPETAVQYTILQGRVTELEEIIKLTRKEFSLEGGAANV